MPITVKGPDGSTVQFPDGTSQATMEAALQSHFGGLGTPQKRAAVPVKTREQEIRDIARSRVAQTDKANKTGIYSVPVVGNFLQGLRDATAAAQSGFTNMLPFEILTRLQAAVEYYSGNSDKGVKSYQDQLAVDREVGAQTRSKSTLGNVIGSAAGLVGGGAGLARAGEAAAARLTASSLPGLARTGRALRTVQTLQKGQKAKNIAKLAAGGAGYAATDAVLDNKSAGDVAESTLIGAVAAPVAVGGLKALGFLGRGVADLLGIRGGPAILRSVIDAPREEIERRAAAFRQRTGAEPTIYELLPKGDRERFANHVLGSSSQAQEAGAAAVQRRVANMRPEMRNRAQQILDPARQRVLQQMQDDLAASRGVTRADLTPAEVGSVEAAGQAPVDLENLRRQRNQNILDPVRNNVVAPDVQSLFPTVPTRNAQGGIEEVLADPEAAAAIRNAAGSLGLRRPTPGQDLGLPNASGVPDGLTADDLANIVQRLEIAAGRDTPERGAAERALAHVNAFLAERAPAAAEAIAAMRASHAAGSRALEGMREGARARLREDVPVVDRSTAQDVANAYDTPEGAAGRVLGQSNTTTRSFEGTPQQSARAIQDLSASSQTIEPIARNVGQGEAAALTDAAQAQADSLRALASTSKDLSKGADNRPDVEGLFTALLSLDPGTMIRTKVFGLTRLKQLRNMSASKAEYLINRLVSQDPQQVAQGLSLLNNAGLQGRKFLRELAEATIIGGNLGSAATDRGEPVPDAVVQNLDGSIGPDPAGLDAPTDAPQENQNLPYGHQVIQSLFPDAEVTSDVRDPNDPLSRKNPTSYHTRSQNAVDVRPIPGLTFEQFVNHIKGSGYKVLEAIDEVNHPSKDATGPHWHVVVAQ